MTLSTPLAGPRLPLPEAPFDAAVGDRLARLMPRRAGTPPLALFRLLATDGPLSEAMSAMGRFQLTHAPGRASAIAAADRELVILRLCARCDCEYEWGVHVSAYADAVGLNPALVRATRHAAADDGIWSPRQRVLVRLVDELHAQARVGDATWADLRATWSGEQCLHLVTLVGWYRLIAGICVSLALPLEPWAARFEAEG
jgi:alkylhydroperoxidase family enzyme